MVLAVFQYARMAKEFIGATQFNAVFSLERGKERGRKGQQYFGYYTETNSLRVGSISKFYTASFLCTNLHLTSVMTLQKQLNFHTFLLGHHALDQIKQILYEIQILPRLL